jgi:SAM-dependent methyltransferase
VTEVGLMSAAGQELLIQLAGLDVDPDRALALSAGLRRQFPAELVAAGLTQQALRMAGRAKFGRADQMLFTRAGLEQASSELTARHAAKRLAAARVVVDLCCGIGGNLVALAKLAADGCGSDGGGGGDDRGAGGGTVGRLVIGVDRDLASLAFARHNVAVHAPSAPVGYVCADVRSIGLIGVDAAFIDPARRDERGRLPAGRYQPPLDWCLALADVVPAVGIKAAPGLSADLVPVGWETEFVAVGRDLKEALLWSPALASATSRATVLPAGDTLVALEPRAPAASIAAPGAFLYDPSPAVTRAGLVAELALQLAAWQIDPMIAFLSADEPKRTPFARTLRVIESAPWHEKRFAAKLRELGVGSADIRRRGLAGDVAQIHRRLGLRGPGAAVIVLTRVSGRPWGLICVPAF